MKQYIIGFITGACLIASAVMFMGASKSGKIGKYQAFAVFDGKMDMRYMIDTQTGKMWYHKYRDMVDYGWLELKSF